MAFDGTPNGSPPQPTDGDPGLAQGSATAGPPTPHDFDKFDASTSQADNVGSEPPRPHEDGNGQVADSSASGTSAPAPLEGSDVGIENAANSDDPPGPQDIGEDHNQGSDLGVYVAPSPVDDQINASVSDDNGAPSPMDYEVSETSASAVHDNMPPEPDSAQYGAQSATALHNTPQPMEDAEIGGKKKKRKKSRKKKSKD